MKVFLINPPTGLYVREDRCQSSVGDFAVSVVRPPMDLMMMASSLESKNITCKIKDYPVEGGDYKDFKNDLSVFLPDILVVSTTTPTLKYDLLSCKITKEVNPKALTVAKGAHFLVNDFDALTDFAYLDVVIRGENELVINEIATRSDFSEIRGITYRYIGQIKRNSDRPFLDNLDELPIPARHLVRNELYCRPDIKKPMAIIETSRGCPGNCIFCLVGQVAGKKIRYRSFSQIIQEIKDCIAKYSINDFHFKSDTFTWNKEWVLGLCNEIIRLNLNINWICNSRVDTLDEERLFFMKKAGCCAIGLGIESGNQYILNKIKKGTTIKQSKDAIALCRRFGVKSYAYFIIGFPWDTDDTINSSIQFALETNPDFVDFFLPYPFPGTELEKIGQDYKIIDKSVKAKAYAHPIMNTLYVSKEKLFLLRKKALKKFYMRPNYIIKTLLAAKSPKILFNYFYWGVKALTKFI